MAASLIRAQSAKQKGKVAMGIAAVFCGCFRLQTHKKWNVFGKLWTKFDTLAALPNQLTQTLETNGIEGTSNVSARLFLV